MKTSHIIFKFLGYFIILGGLALLTFYALYPSEMDWETPYESNNYQEEMHAYEGVEATQEAQKTLPKEEAKITNSPDNVTSLEGSWKVTYNTKNLKGAIVYNMKKEGALFNAYTSALQDENGYEEKVPLVKTLIITVFNGKKGNGTYKIEYEGQPYDVPCIIKMINNNTFQLSYEYYGYSDTETWKRQL